MAFGVASIEARGSPAILSAISTHDLADILFEQYLYFAGRRQLPGPLRAFVDFLKSAQAETAQRP
jgi:hypothetical protein